VIYAREAVLKQDLFQLRDAIDQYYADKVAVSRHAGRAGQRRLRAQAARRSVHQEQQQLADRAGRTRSETIRPRKAGVYDVKSGSDADPALDGNQIRRLGLTAAGTA